MELVLLTALGVGGATVIGAAIGFAFKNISHKFSDIILSFAAGVMLAAAVLGLIMPSLEYGGKYGLVTTIAGIFAGALILNVIDKGRVEFTNDVLRGDIVKGGILLTRHMAQPCPRAGVGIVVDGLLGIE